MNFNGTVKQKIDDLVAEYGLGKEVIKYIPNQNPCAFAIYGHYYVTLVAENEVDDLCRWIVNERIYTKWGDEFLVHAPIELLDRCVKPETWRPIVSNYYETKAEKDASRSFYGGYPNTLVRNCVDNEIIEDADMDRYFNSDGSWVDARAQQDLVKLYVNVMTDRALIHPCSWYMENVAKYGFRSDLTDLILKKKSLLDRKLAVDTALEWEMDDCGAMSSTDFLTHFVARWDQKVHMVGEFLAFFMHDPKFLRMDPSTFNIYDMLGLRTIDDKPSTDGSTVTEDQDEDFDNFDFSILTDRKVDVEPVQTFAVDMIVCDPDLSPEEKCCTVQFPAVTVSDALEAIRDAILKHPIWFPAHLFQGRKNYTHELADMLFDSGIVKLEPSA